MLPFILTLSTSNCVTPATAVLEAPRATVVELKVTELFANELFAMFVSVLSGPLIVLFVNVCVAAKPAKFSDCKAVLNSAKLPVKVLFAKSIVLFVSVSVESSVTTFESKLIEIVSPEAAVVIPEPPVILSVSVAKLIVAAV